MSLTVLVTGSGAVQAADDIDAVVRSTVRVSVKGEDELGRAVSNWGTGFLLDTGGSVLTAFHVVGRHRDGTIISWKEGFAGNPRITVERYGANGTLEVINATIVVKQTNRELDVALLEFAGANYPSVSCKIDELESNARLSAVAWRPGRDSYDFLHGTLAPLDANDGGRRRLANMAANEGNSGGPVFDSSAAVVGIVTAGRNQVLNPGANETFATLLSDLPREWLGCLPRATAPSLAGAWFARVRYSWGDSFDERFEFSVRGDELHGTAGYYTYAEEIQDGRVDGNHLSFRVRRQLIVNNEERPTTYRYDAKLVGSDLRFVMVDDYFRHNIAFVATRSRDAIATAAEQVPYGGTEPSLLPLSGDVYNHDFVRGRIEEKKDAIRECFRATEYEPPDHQYPCYGLKFAAQGALIEVDTSSGREYKKLGECMDQVFRGMTWGRTVTGREGEMRVCFDAPIEWAR